MNRLRIFAMFAIASLWTVTPGYADATEAPPLPTPEATAAAPSSSTIDWQQFAASVEGGYVYSLTLTPKNLLIAATDCGLYRSGDHGETWSICDKRLAGKPVQAFVAGSNGLMLAISSGTVYKSFDDGTTWSSSPVAPKYAFTTIVADEAGHMLAYGPTTGVCCYSTKGDTWAPANSGLPGSRVRRLFVAPNGQFYATTDAGLFKWYDDGKKWDKTGTLSSACAITTDSAGRLVVADGRTIYSSKDAKNWTRLTKTESTAVEDYMVVCGDGTVLASTFSGLYRYLPDSDAWTGPQGTDARVTALIKDTVGRIYVATGGAGIFKSTDDGRTWTKCNTGLAAGSISCLAAGSKGLMFAGGPGVWKTADFAQTWTDVKGGPTLSCVHAMLATPKGALLAATTGGRIYRTADNGATWTEAASIAAENGILTLAAAPSGDIFAGADNGLLRSTDDGEHWTVVKDGPTASFTAIGFGKEGCVLAGTDGGALYTSTDSGGTFTKADGLVTDKDGRVGRLACLAGLPDGSVVAAADFGGIQKSTDNGTTWQPIATDARAARAMLVDKQGRVFVADSSGVICSTDGGQSLTRYTLGKPPADIKSLGIDASGFLYAGTSSQGVWRSVSPVAP